VLKQVVHNDALESVKTSQSLPGGTENIFDGNGRYFDRDSKPGLHEYEVYVAHRKKITVIVVMVIFQCQSIHYVGCLTRGP
jgi:hypothetical protein